MKKLKSLTLLSAIAICPLFVGCDGGSSTDNEDAITQLSASANRGLDLNEVLNNPFASPGFPYSLSEGETITFIPTDVPARSFIQQVPLGTWVAESSGLLRQGSITTNNLYFPVTEETFRHLYAVEPTASEPELVSTQDSAFITYTFEHRIDDRQGDFIDKVDQILATSSEPGSLSHAISSAGFSAERNRVIVDAVSSLGIAAFDHPDGNQFINLDGITSVTVRRSRNITLHSINSSNIDLTPGGDQVITGFYTLRDSLQQVTLFGNEGDVGLNTTAGGGDEIVIEQSAGSFIMRLNQLTRIP